MIESKAPSCRRFAFLDSVGGELSTICSFKEMLSGGLGRGLDGTAMGLGSPFFDVSYVNLSNLDFKFFTACKDSESISDDSMLDDKDQ